MTGNRKAEILNALTSSRARLDEEKQKLSQSELDIQRFKQQTHLPDITVDKAQKISDAGATEAEVKRVQAEVASATARLNALKADRQRQPDFIDSPTTVSNNTAKQAVKDQIAQLNNDRARLLGYYKPDAFQIKQVDTQIAQQEQRLADTPDSVTTITHAPNPVLSMYDQRVSEAQAVLSAAQAQLDKQQSHARTATAALVKYSTLDRRQAELQRSLEEHQTNVKALTGTVQMLNLRDGAWHDPMMTITPAGTALQVAPRVGVNIAYSAVVGLILALALALLQEFLDDRVNSLDDARRLLQTPALGYVPLIEKEEGRLLNASRSSGAVLEAYRVVRSNVQFATLGSPVCSLLVTSTVPGEGKSVTATNLAIAMALDGKKVILVDADLRRSTIHQKFGVPQNPGLTNVLIGHTSLEAALRDTDFPGLRLLTAGPQPPNPAELLNSEPMQRLHERLKEYADIVIYDSPPCLATADTQVLSASVDGVVYVIHLGETKKSGITHAMELLEQAHANVLGVIFNKMSGFGRQEGYYGYYGYYQSVDGKDGGQRRVSSEFEALFAGNGAESADALAVVLPAPETGDKPHEKEDNNARS
jgi:polysaccharide biosynthesis transport protein